MHDLKVTFSTYLSTIYLQTLIFDFISFVILFVLHPIDGVLIALLALFVTLLGPMFQAVLASIITIASHWLLMLLINALMGSVWLQKGSYNGRVSST